MSIEKTDQAAQNTKLSPSGKNGTITEFLAFEIQEKIATSPLRIRGIALVTGISRNLNFYTTEELSAFAGKLVNAPMYIEHISVPFAVGKVTNTVWDGQRLLYEAEIYDEEAAEKIRKGLIKHVSVGADYESVDLINGKIPHGLHNAELSLVAVPGIPEANIQIIEKLQLQNTFKNIVPQNLTDSNDVESLIKKPAEPTIRVSEVVRLIEQVLPPVFVKRSWSLGPQRMCQELQKMILSLQSNQTCNQNQSHNVTGSS